MMQYLVLAGEEDEIKDWRLFLQVPGTCSAIDWKTCLLGPD